MNFYWVLLIITITISALGWKKFLYFISVGYGFSIAGCALAMIIKYWTLLTVPTAVLCVLLLAYGCRLGGYLLYRDLRSASYRKAFSANNEEKDYSITATLSIWISCAFLYLAQVFPVASRLANTAAGEPVNDCWAWAGAFVMLLGIVVESVADAQKSAAKKVNPRRFVDTGLYRIVRCPNYFGEMVMWTGCLVVCIGASCSWWQWLVSIIGYAAIVYIMFSGARRLELRQDKHYGTDPEYQAYAEKTPILVPFLPIYSVARHSWLRG